MSQHTIKHGKHIGSATILAVEDEEAIRDMISFSLERAGHTVVGVGTASAALQFLADNPVDLVLIDWMLPGSSGLELLKRLRSSDATSALPAIMLTAKTDESDITRGLDAGADDYIGKPFSPRELNSRIKAILRRTGTGEKLLVDRLVLDNATHTLSCDGEKIELGHTEFKLLRFLMTNPERVYSRAQLLDHVWGSGTFIEERTVDVHILRLRKALKPARQDYLVDTIRGAGYRLTTSTQPGHDSVD